jgi:hypothetical protein
MTVYKVSDYSAKTFTQQGIEHTQLLRKIPFGGFVIQP